MFSISKIEKVVNHSTLLPSYPACQPFRQRYAVIKNLLFKILGTLHCGIENMAYRSFGFVSIWNVNEKRYKL